MVSPTSFEFLVKGYAKLLQEAAEAERMAKEAAEMKAEKDYLKRIKSLDDLRQEIGHASITEILTLIRR